MSRANVVVILYGAQVRRRQFAGQVSVVQLGGTPAYLPAPPSVTNAHVILADAVARAFLAVVHCTGRARPQRFAIADAIVAGPVA